jgi:hypothetical protein
VLGAAGNGEAASDRPALDVDGKAQATRNGLVKLAPKIRHNAFLSPVFSFKTRRLAAGSSVSTPAR